MAGLGTSGRLGPLFHGHRLAQRRASKTRLAATYVKKDNPVLAWPGASVVIKSGRSSLQVFCLGAILTVLLSLFVAAERPVVVERIALDFGAILLIALVATLLMRFRVMRSRAPRRQAPASPEMTIANPQAKGLL